MSNEVDMNISLFYPTQQEEKQKRAEGMKRFVELG